jgi:ABC-type transporter Mla subunit MlaD
VLSAGAAIYYFVNALADAHDNSIKKEIEQDIEKFKELAKTTVKEGQIFSEVQIKKGKDFAALLAALQRGVTRQSGRGDDNSENYIKSLNAQLEDTIRINGEVTASFRSRDRQIVENGRTAAEVTAILRANTLELGKALNDALKSKQTVTEWSNIATELRDRFSEAQKEAQKLNDHLSKAIEKNKKYILDARQEMEARQFDLSLGGAGDAGKLKAEIAKVLQAACHSRQHLDDVADLSIEVLIVDV